MLFWILGSIAFGLVMLAGLAWWSARLIPSAGLVEGRLRPAPTTENGVCSETGTPESARIAPFTFSGTPDDAWKRLQQVVAAHGGRTERVSSDYLWATFRSPLLRFVDDVEFRLDRDHGVIHVRSASRVGRSDLGANRRRIEALRHYFATGSQATAGSNPGFDFVV